MDTVHKLASGDAILCPKYAWAAIVRRIRSYLEPTTTLPCQPCKWMSTHVTSKILIDDALEGAIEAVGIKDRIGF
eukprot:scaffold192793_cov40-Cyclotella_meneghiniana.AAC.1